MLTDTTWNLHTILVNPEAKPEEVKSAKKQMLKVLEETGTFPQMIVPPILQDNTLACRRDERPSAARFVQSRIAFSKGAREPSSRNSRAKHSNSRYGTVSAKNIAATRREQN